MYAILDIETTGLSPAREKITEIAIFLHDGKQIVDQYSTLIDPEKKISYRITQLTGISNPMVENAPRFYEVAKKMVEMTEGTVVVGHNVRFDYGFLRQEFLRLGFDFQRQTLDTVKLSRKLIPGQPSYSLGKLCQSLGINNLSRHRAAGDALATVQLFELLLSLDPDIGKVRQKSVTRDINRSLTENLPRKTGVYYFYDKAGEIIYVGKSVNIRERVLSHLNNNLDKKELEMKSRLHEVRFQVTGSELVALLLESAEIKKYQPVYNRAQRRTYYSYGLYSFTGSLGYKQLKLTRIIDGSPPLYTYGSAQEGKEHVEQLCQKFGLCRKLTGLSTGDGPCFHYQIHQCGGACIGEESATIYNERVTKAIENYHFDRQNFILIDDGRHSQECAVVKIQQGKYRGFGFVPSPVLRQKGFVDWDDYLVSQQDNKEVRRIILSAMKKGKVKSFALGE
jgi:DNA polymerase-3 subunit epsilon